MELKDILQYEFKPLLRKHYLNMDTITIFVGDRGSGKSVSSVATAIIDYALEGFPIWSNMDIKCTFDVDAETAGKYGLAPGQVTFQSLPLDKDRFLDGDPEYTGGCAVIEEINIWLADARRAMSNQNLAASDLVQMIRKLKTALIANCIHEMFVDNRIRDAVDNFVTCEDSALLPEGQMAHKLQGEEFNLKIWPMTRKLNGLRHWEGGMSLVTLKGRPWWGTFDTTMRQERIKYRPVMYQPTSEEIETKPFRTKWAGYDDRLRNAVAEFIREGQYPIKNEYLRVPSLNIWDKLGIDENEVDRELRAILEEMGARKTNTRAPGGGFYWMLPANLALAEVL